MNGLLLTPASSQLESAPIPVFRAEREFQLIDLWKVVLRRKALLLWTVAAAVLSGFLYCAFVPPLYQAEGQLQVLKQNSTAFLGDTAQASASAAADALDFNLAAQTQVDVIKSRNVALAVIQKLHLDKQTDYQLQDQPEENAKALTYSPRHEAFVLALFEKRLHASTVPGTRLLSISFLDRSPQRAAEIVNDVIATFMFYNSQVQFNTGSEATKLLATDLHEMKAKVDAAQGEVIRLQQQSGIYGVDATTDATNAKLEQLNAQLTVAQSNRTLKQSIYTLARSRSPEVLSGMIGATSTGANTANAPLQMLRQQQAEASANYADLLAHYGTQYPKVQQAKERLQSIQDSINGEINRLVGQSEAEYKVALDTEAGASRALAAQKVLAAQMNHDALLYTSAKHDADTSRALYEELQKRLTEADIVAGLHSTNLNVLDPAITPAQLAQPRWLIDLLIALAGGFIAGLLLLFTADALDSAVRDPRKIEEMSGLPVLGLIPPADRYLLRSLRKPGPTSHTSYQITSRAPRSMIAEAFRGLRASILSRLPVTKNTAIAITSTSESEGKSFTTINLAATFAQSGRTVLVIDADLRKRTLSASLGIDDQRGLRELLGGAPWEDLVVEARDTPGLFLLSAGDPSNLPADVIAAPEMIGAIHQLRSAFDMVLIDTPSVLEVADTLSFASSVDALLVVAKSGSTAEHALMQTLSTLMRVNGTILGIVLNNIDFNSADYRFHCGKRGKGYAHAAPEIIASGFQISASRARVATVLIAFALSGTFAKSQDTHVQGTTRTTTCLNGRSILGLPAATPTAAPKPETEASQKLVVGTGDLLSISIFDAPELAQEVRVNGAGNVHLLLLGDVPARGLQVDQLAANIEALLQQKDLIASPNVSISVKEFATQGVTIEGEVHKPGVYPVFSEHSLLDLIAMADGTTTTADNEVTIRRKATGKVELVTLSQDDGNVLINSDVRVYPGDIIVIPRAGYAYVMGDVQRPGGYIMHDNGHMTVMEAISEAQGTGRTASLKQVLLLRKVDGQTQKIAIQLKAIQRGQQPDVPLEAGDIVFVPTSGLKTFQQDTAGIFASVSGAALYAAK